MIRCGFIAREFQHVFFFYCFSFKSDTIKWICICIEVYHAYCHRITKPNVYAVFIKICSITHTGCWRVLVICHCLRVATLFQTSRFIIAAVVDSCARLYALGWECNFQWSQVFEKYPIWRQMFVFYFEILEWVFAYKTATHRTTKTRSHLFHPAYIATPLLSLSHQTASHILSFKPPHAHIFIHTHEKRKERESIA